MIEKPPLGIMPKWLWQERRFNELCGAITRAYNASWEIHIEWVEEYNELVREMRARKAAQTAERE